MTPIAIAFLCLAILIVWGGLIASTLYLRRRPELDAYPPGGVDDEREDSAQIVPDT